MKKTIILILGAFIYAQAFSQFQHSYGTPGDESGQSIRWTGFDGGFVIAGYSDYKFMPGYNATISKISKNGSVYWARIYGGDGSDYFNSVRQVNPRGYEGYVALGSTNSIGAGASDMLLVKTDTFGSPTSVYTYGDKQYEGGSCLQVVRNPLSKRSEIIMIGHSSSYYPVIDKKMFIVKATLTGQFLDAIVFGDEGSHAGYWIEQTSDGGFIAVGTTSNSCCCGHYPGLENYDIFIAKLNYNLNVEWARTIGGDSNLFVNDVANSVKETFDGYVVTGYTQSFSSNSTKDVFLLKLDKKGGFKWLRNYGTTGDDTGNDVLHLKDTTIGYEYLVNGTTTIDGAKYALLMATDYFGNLKWSKIYGMASNNEEGLEIVQNGKKGYAFTGSVKSFGAGLRDIYHVVTDDYGNSNCPVCEKKIKMSSMYHQPCIKKNYIYKHVKTGIAQKIEYDFMKLKQDECPNFFIFPKSDFNSSISDVNSAEQLKVYPNPATDQIYIELPDNFRHGIIKVYNTTGQLIIVENLVGKVSIQVSIKNQNSGLYIIHAINENGRLIKARFLKN